MVHSSTNVLFDLLFIQLLQVAGLDVAQRIALSLQVLNLFCVAFVLLCVGTGQRPWLLVPCLATRAYELMFHAGFCSSLLAMGSSRWALALLGGQGVLPLQLGLRAVDVLRCRSGDPGTEKGCARPHYEIFLYLQILDFLTTLVGLRIGLQELSPFIRQIMHLDAALGLAALKLLAVSLAGFCIWSQTDHVIRSSNYLYAALVVWNLCIILAMQPAL